jgi:hypothetical protein
MYVYKFLHIRLSPLYFIGKAAIQSPRGPPFIGFLPDVFAEKIDFFLTF